MQNYHQTKHAVAQKNLNLIPTSSQASNPTHKIIDEVVLRLSQAPIKYLR